MDTNKKYHEDFLELSNSAVQFEGKDVLEVGGCELPGLLKKFKPKRWTAIDISENRLGLLDKCEIPEFYHYKKMDITNTSFKNNSFDYIFSLDCFEHIFALDAAFNEMYRILRPNGTLVAKFGPIWSSPIGHHTWVEHNGKLLHFNNNLFNDWFHLAYPKEKFIKILQNQYSDEIASKIAYSVYESNDINRLIDTDYMKIVNKNKFNTILMMTSKKGKKPGVELKRKIFERYPQITNLHSTTFLIILSKGRLSSFKKIKIYKRLFWHLIKHKLTVKFS